MRFSAACVLLLYLGSVARGQQGGLVLSQTIPMPNVQGGFNHMSVDAKGQQLFAAAPTNKTLEVVDLKLGKPLRSVEGEKPAAVRYAPEFNQLYVARGQSIVIYDPATFAVIARVDLGTNLDELQYDARAKRLYVGCMTEGKTGVAVIAIPEGKLVGRIALPAKPQGVAVEENSSRIFANMPTLRQVAVMDRENLTLMATWTLEGVEGNTPIGLDERRHRLFVGARHPAQLVVLDTSTGKTVARLDTNADADDLFYDQANQRIYISCGEGFIDVIEQQAANDYKLLSRVPTAAGARTSTLSVPLKGFYLAVPRRGDQPAELRTYRIAQ